IKFELIIDSIPFLLDGARLSLLVSSLAVTIGICLGIIAASARLSKVWIFRAIASAYIAFLRGTPMIVQIFIVHFGLSHPAIGLTLPALASGVIALSLNSGAYMGEVFRGGIQSIDIGQTQAGLSLGY